MKRTHDEWPLALPLAALFVVCFFAPFVVLVAMSLHADAQMQTWSIAQYVKFFGDAFNLGILASTSNWNLLPERVFSFLNYSG